MLTVKPGKTRIGWIGTGVMGGPMCGHIMDKGFSMTVYTRAKDKAKPLLKKGAVWADSPGAVAKASDVVFTMVGFPSDVQDVYLGDRGVLAGAKKGSILVDMTTTEPSLAQKIYAAAKSKNAHSVDAPVSGGDVGAREARLSIMVGGDREAVEAVMPLFQALGKTIVHQGGAGAGQHDDRGLRKPYLRAQGGTGPYGDALVHSWRRGGLLDVGQHGSPNFEPELRPRVLR
jgi:3-hydroxyisobutyrate dehydrogenase